VRFAAFASFLLTWSLGPNLHLRSNSGRLLIAMLLNSLCVAALPRSKKEPAGVNRQAEGKVERPMRRRVLEAVSESLGTTSPPLRQANIGDAGAEREQQRG
jgi:hypothetical protein